MACVIDSSKLEFFVTPNEKSDSALPNEDSIQPLQDFLSNVKSNLGQVKKENEEQNGIGILQTTHCSKLSEF